MFKEVTQGYSVLVAAYPRYETHTITIRPQGEYEHITFLISNPFHNLIALKKILRSLYADTFPTVAILANDKGNTPKPVQASRLEV